MAKALQCPSCGTKKRIGALGGGDTFQCEGCGQVTKVPPGLQDDHRSARSRATPDPVVAAVASRQDAPPAPPKRRGGAVVAAGGTAATPAPAPAVSDAPGGGVAVAAPPVRGSGGRRSTPIDDAPDAADGKVKVVWRVLAWLVALPIALGAVGIPARRAGYLNSQRLLDVIVDSGLTRFVPILVIVVLWALVTALLVTVFLAVGQRLAARRRRRRRAGRNA